MNCDQPELFIMVWTSCLWFHNTRLALAGFSSRNYNLTFRLWYLLTVSCKSVWISLVSPQILRCCNVLFPYLPEPPASFSTDVDSTTHTNCLLRSFFARWSDLCIRTEVKKKKHRYLHQTLPSIICPWLSLDLPDPIVSLSWCPSDPHISGQLKYTQKVSTYQAHQGPSPTFSANIETENILKKVIREGPL